MNPDITQQILELAQPLAEEQGLFVVDVELKTNSGNELWVYVDGEDKSVNLDECADISRELGFLIDAHELLDSKYRLNVSSPGLSRPLTDRRQYRKNIGRTIKVRYTTADGTQRVTGTLSDLKNEEIGIKETNGKEEKLTQVAIDAILEAKILPQL